MAAATVFHPLQAGDCGSNAVHKLAKREGLLTDLFRDFWVHAMQQKISLVQWLVRP